MAFLEQQLPQSPIVKPANPPGVNSNPPGAPTTALPPAPTTAAPVSPSSGGRPATGYPASTSPSSLPPLVQGAGALPPQPGLPPAPGASSTQPQVAQPQQPVAGAATGATGVAGAPGTAAFGPTAVALTRIPKSGDFASYPAGTSFQTPYGTHTIGPDGRPTVSFPTPQHEQRYRQAMAEKRSKYGALPRLIHGMPGVPEPPITLEGAAFNPFTGMWVD